jgi:hypothetical protein
MRHPQPSAHSWSIVIGLSVSLIAVIPSHARSFPALPLTEETMDAQPTRSIPLQAHSPWVHSSSRIPSRYVVPGSDGSVLMCLSSLGHGWYRTEGRSNSHSSRPPFSGPARRPSGSRARRRASLVSANSARPQLQGSGFAYLVRHRQSCSSQQE